MAAKMYLMLPQPGAPHPVPVPVDAERIEPKHLTTLWGAGMKTNKIIQYARVSTLLFEGYLKEIPIGGLIDTVNERMEDIEGQIATAYVDIYPQLEEMFAALREVETVLGYIKEGKEVKAIETYTALSYILQGEFYKLAEALRRGQEIQDTHEIIVDSLNQNNEELSENLMKVAKGSADELTSWVLAMHDMVGLVKDIDEHITRLERYQLQTRQRYDEARVSFSQEKRKDALLFWEGDPEHNIRSFRIMLFSATRNTTKVDEGMLAKAQQSVRWWWEQYEKAFHLWNAFSEELVKNASRYEAEIRPKLQELSEIVRTIRTFNVKYGFEGTPITHAEMKETLTEKDIILFKDGLRILKDSEYSVSQLQNRTNIALHAIRGINELSLLPSAEEKKMFEKSQEQLEEYRTIPVDMMKEVAVPETPPQREPTQRSLIATTPPPSSVATAQKEVPRERTHTTEGEATIPIKISSLKESAYKAFLCIAYITSCNNDLRQGQSFNTLLYAARCLLGIDGQSALKQAEEYIRKHMEEDKIERFVDEKPDSNEEIRKIWASTPKVWISYPKKAAMGTTYRYKLSAMATQKAERYMDELHITAEHIRKASEKSREQFQEYREKKRY